MDKARLIAELRTVLEGYRDAEHVLLGILRAVEIAWDRVEEASPTTTKESILAHYATGDVHKFKQIDGWLFGEPNANKGTLGATDEDGDCLNAGETVELRHSSAALAVRMFIHEGTCPKDAVRLVRKMLDWVERSPELLSWEDMGASG